MNGDVYASAANSMSWLLTAIEEKLPLLPENSIIDGKVVAGFGITRIYNPEQLAASLKALTEVGVLTKHRDVYKLNSPGLTQGLLLARGIRMGIRWHSELEADSVELCVALPTGLTGEVENYFRQSALDLRASIVDLISSADEKLVLVSPFWDYETAQELSELLLRRLEAGIHIDIIGRFDSDDDAALGVVRQRLVGYPRCRVFRWSKPLADDRFGRQTFHFKSISVDHGAAVYVGSANFTTGGLRSRMELGLILRGPVARQVHQCVREVLKIAVII